MKLLRYGNPGAERPALIDKTGAIRDLSEHVSDIDGALLAAPRLSELAKIDLQTLPLVPASHRIGPCVGGVGKFVCIGLNYFDHAAEAKLQAPTEPIIFMKATSAISGPNDDIIPPKLSKRTDWDVELGKSRDSFGPIGPWLVTKDEIVDPHNLELWLSVNGVTMQRGTTASMIFSVAFIVHYMSQFMTLQPGDIIATGTPAGVGMGMNPPRYLATGDVVELCVAGLGSQRQVVASDHQ